MFDFSRWINRAGTGLNKFTNSGTAGNLILTPNPDSITTPGTPITAAKLNHMENGIAITSDTLDRCFAFFSDFHILANAEAKFAHDVLLDGFGNSSGMTLGDWTFSTGTISCSTPTPQTQYNYARYTWSQNPSTYAESADSAHDETIFSSGTYSISGYPSAPIVNGQFTETGAFTTITKAYDDSGDFFLYTVSPDGKTRTTHELKLATALDPDSKYITWTNTVIETPGAYVKGDYVDTIQSPAGIYPDDGISGAYWYVKGSAAPTPLGGTVVATSDAYTLSEEKNAVTLEAISTDDGTATVKYQVTLDGSNWSDILPGQAISLPSGSSLQVRILGVFVDNDPATVSCDGFSILAYKVESE